MCFCSEKGLVQLTIVYIYVDLFSAKIKFYSLK